VVAAGTVVDDLRERFPGAGIVEKPARDDIPTLWVAPEHARDVLSYLKPDYKMLYDLSAVDERARRVPADQPAGDFTIVYNLVSIDRNADVRVKVPLQGEYPSIPTITDLWPNANWYEREAWDMFGIKFQGHPFLQRLLMPPGWEGHPLRKEYPARATDLPGFELPQDKTEQEVIELQQHPEEFGLGQGAAFRDFRSASPHSNPETTGQGDQKYMFLNFGPHHPGTHGLLRAILQLDGEEIVDSTMDIGWHHRGAEKMAERQTFHTYIPYTDRVDYLSGFQNELPYVMAVERLGGIDVPPRAQYIRVMLCELFRIANHLVWFGTFGADVGAMSPVFFTFNDRERIFDIIEAISGGRMHPGWFRIGGVAADLPDGWKQMVDDFVRYFPARIVEYNDMVVRNSIFRQRTKGVGVYTQQSAIDWGVTGPNLRSTGIDWDLRKKRPYCSYDHFDFDVPTATDGDCYARCLVRMEEMAQSLRIVKQAADNMPDGPYKSDNRLAMPPRKEQTMEAIETLINHFLSVSWGQPMPAGEAMMTTEAPKGNYSYYVVSDGSNYAYRCRIRTASFPHIQSVPMLCRGLLVSDLIAILGSIDFVLADVDR
jgi:NADH-quinone oxidoreductase subunit C/D